MIVVKIGVQTKWIESCETNWEFIAAVYFMSFERYKNQKDCEWYVMNVVLKYEKSNRSYKNISEKKFYPVSINTVNRYGVEIFMMYFMDFFVKQRMMKNSMDEIESKIFE